MNIIQAIKHEQLFRPFLADSEGSIRSWTPWLTCLRVIYGLPLRRESQRAFAQACTGRTKFPPGGFDTSYLLCPRHSGKSRISAVIGCHEGILAGHEERLDAGESGLVAILSPTKRQSQTIKKYMSALMNSTPMLRAAVKSETKLGYELTNGITVEIQTGDYRAVRGASIVCGLVDEACFFGVLDETVKSDTELIRAILPKIMAVGGRLVVISSKHAKKGHCYDQWKKHYGQDASKTLIWSPADSRTMNPTLEQAVIDRAMEDDPAMARSELFNEWREDCQSYITRAQVEKLVVRDRTELLPHPGMKYSAYCDLSSGGAKDDSALAIGFQREGKIYLAKLKRYRPPFSPFQIVADMSNVLRSYGLNCVTGDLFAPGMTTDAFQAHQIAFVKCDRSKNELYAELLPRLTSETVELLDSPPLVNQLVSLQRRTSRGKDIFDHPRGGHDDLAVCLAGVSYLVGRGVIHAGALPFGDDAVERGRYDLLQLIASQPRIDTDNYFR